MVAFRAAATATNPAATSASSFTITKPTGTADNDVMVMVLNCAVGAVPTVPAGWILLEGPVTSILGGPTEMDSYLYKKKAASEGASYAVSFSGGATTISGSITSFSSASDVDNWQSSLNDDNDPTNIGITLTPTRTSLVLDVLAWRDTTIDTGTASTGTEAFDVGQFNTGSTQVRGMVGYYRSATTAAGVLVSENIINMTNSITSSVMWTVAIADTVPANESWSSTATTVELNINGTWTDVTSDVRYEDGINITRGTNSQGGQVSPSSATFTLDNRSGSYSVLNPTSTHYPYLQLSTQCRIAKASGTVAMESLGFDDVIADVTRPVDRFRTTSSGPLDITGDIQISVDCEPETWKQEQVLAAKWQTQSFGGLGNYNASWVFYIDGEGIPHLAWIEGDAGFNVYHNVSATSAVPALLRQSVRVFLDVNNGASGHTVTFYTASTRDGSYTQLGDAVVTTGTTTVNNGLNAALTVGAIEPLMDPDFTYTVDSVDNPYFSPFRGRIYGARVQSGTSTTVASPDFSSQTTGTKSFTDTEGNLWVGYGHAVCHNRNYRHHGEITQWPQTRDTTGNDSWVNVESYSPLNREVQGDDSVSALKSYYANNDGITQVANGGLAVDAYQGPFFPVGYWPLEDEADTSRPASGLSDGTPGFVIGQPEFAADDSWRSSAANVNMKSDSSIRLPVVNALSGSFAVEFLVFAPSGITNGAVIAEIRHTGAATTTKLIYDSTNTVSLHTYDSSGTQIDTSGGLSINIVNRHNRFAITGIFGVAQLFYQNVGDPGFADSGAFVDLGGDVGKVVQVKLNPNGTMTDVYMGHVAVFDGTSSNTYPYGSAYGYTQLELNSYTTELAAARAKRLVEEMELISYNIGDGGEAMGYQFPGVRRDKLQEVQDSDGGFVYEPRNALGMGYRTLKSMYNAPAVLELSYEGFDLSGAFTPVKDNRGVRNDMTVQREHGASSRFAKTTGTNSVAAIGRYSDSVTLSLTDDSQTGDQAGWRVWLGTNNDLRVDTITLALENPRIGGDSDMIRRFYMADIGDRITLADLPTLLQPEDMSQTIVGYTERFDQFTHEITFNTVPGSLFETAVSVLTTSTTASKAGSSTTTLNEDLTTTETGVDVAITSGSALWTTSGIDFDIIVGGERMTVTSVSGASSPQTFTVTRSVNGVVKTHSTGAEVRLFKPAIAAK